VVESKYELPVEVAGSGALPSPPGVLVQITRLVNDPDSTIEELVTVIETDAVLAARLLGTVNSGLYTLVREIHSIRDAAVLVGLRAVRSLALGVSVSANMPDGSACASFDLARYWSHCLMAAVMGKGLAGRVQPDVADDTFAVALIGNVGRLVIATAVPDRYDALLQRHVWPSLRQEQAHLGYHSAQVTAGLLHRWQLPDEFCDAVRHLDDVAELPDDTSPATRHTARIAGTANKGVAFLLDTERDIDPQRIAAAIAGSLDITIDVAGDVLDEAAEHMRAVEHLLADSLPKSVHPSELLSHARDLLQSAAA
jgi:HD-like signal output (HDOD) protein